MSSVWGSGPDDVWLAGGDDAGARLFHYDGAAVSAVEAPDLPLLSWVHGTGPADVFVVSRGGGAAHYDGTAWTLLETGTTEDLWGCFARSATELWAVGGDADVGEPLILRWDGAAFAPVPLDPAQNNRGATTLFKVWGDADHLYIVGQNGIILRWDGAALQAMSGGAEADQDLISLWGTPDDPIVAVGGRGNARIATFDGAAWTTIAPSGVGGINGITYLGPDEALVVGVTGLNGRFVPSTATLTLADPISRLDLHAVWADGAGGAWAVGGSFRAPHEGVALRLAP